MRISKGKWQELENEFLAGELNEEEFCKLKNLDVEWFRQKLDNTESSRVDKRFVELVPEADGPQSSGSGLKVVYRDVTFELPENFNESVFQRALSSVREVM